MEDGGRGILFVLCGSRSAPAVKEERAMEKYEALYMETIAFDAEDVIATSDNEGGKTAFDDLYLE